MRAFSQSRFAALGGGRSDLVIMPSDAVYARVLQPGQSKAVPLPAGAARVLFSADGDFYARFGDANVQATAATADSDEASELNPGPREIPTGATHLALVSADGCSVTLSFYS